MNKKTLSIVGLLLIIVLCLARYVFFNFLTDHADEMQNSCRKHVSEAAFNALADSLEYISTKLELFEFTDIDDNLENIPKREIISQLSQLKNSFYYVSSVYLALENGQYYETSGSGTTELGTENQEWYYKTKRSLKTNFLSVTKDNKTKCGVIATPFYYKGEYVGVIAVEIDNALFKKISDYFGDDLYQLVIKDKYNREMFVFDKNFVATDDYLAQDNSYTFMINNVKEKSKFNVTTYVLKTERKPFFTFLTWLFSIIFVVVIGLTIWKKIRNYKETAVGVFAFQIVIVMTIEILSNMGYYYYLYNEHVKHHELVVEKYAEQMDANSKYISENVWFKVQEKNIFKQNALLESNSNEMKEIMDIFEKTSTHNTHCLNFFFISKDGDYQNYPYNPSYTAKEYNFQLNRTLLNGSDRSTYNLKANMGTWQLKEYVFKVKDDRNNYIGTFGLNLHNDLNDGAIARYFKNDAMLDHLEFRNGRVYEIDSLGEETETEIYLDEKQVEKMNSLEYGIVYAKLGLFTKPYAYVSTMNGDYKRLVPIELATGISVQALFIICGLVSIIGVILSLILSIKEKTESATFENVEDEYEVKLMINEDKFFETLKTDEEVEKGLKILKVFGKKPSKIFAKKIQEYRERNEWKD